MQHDVTPRDSTFLLYMSRDSCLYLTEPGESISLRVPTSGVQESLRGSRTPFSIALCIPGRTRDLMHNGEGRVTNQ